MADPSPPALSLASWPARDTIYYRRAHEARARETRNPDLARRERLLKSDFKAQASRRLNNSCRMNYFCSSRLASIVVAVSSSSCVEKGERGKMGRRLPRHLKHRLRAGKSASESNFSPLCKLPTTSRRRRKKLARARGVC